MKGGRNEVAPDVDLVADVIEHIDRHGEPGNQKAVLHPQHFIVVFKLILTKLFISCFRGSAVFPAWMAGHQSRSGET